MSRFGQLRGEQLHIGLHKDWWQAYDKFDEYKESQLRDLIDGEVFLQGSECKCSSLWKTTSWYVVDDLASQIRCAGCLTKFPLGPTPGWKFRLNELVGNALRKHGTLAVLQALYHLQHYRGLSEMFLYVPCQDIIKKGEEQPFTDLDIVVIRDGRPIVGEVKSDPAAFEAEDFEKMLETAKGIEPNEVIFAAPGEAWPSSVTAEFERYREAVAPLEIDVNPVLLRWL